MPIVSTTKMKAGQFLQLGEDPPGVRLELVDGEVAVSPSPVPDHSYLVMTLGWILNSHIIPKKLGELHHDVDTILDDFNVRRPDILFFSQGRTHLIGRTAMQGPPDLAVEVISPSSVEIDREDKFEQYRKAGVMHYWIIDPAERSVEGWTLQGERYVATGRAVRSGIVRLPPFADLDIPIEKLWRIDRGGEVKKEDCPRRVTKGHE
jgi:Uma2 family endonuclease